MVDHFNKLIEFETINNFKKGTEINFILEMEYIIKPKFGNDHIFLSNYFKKIFNFYPRSVFIQKPYGIIFFISKKPHEILSRRYFQEMSYIRKKLKTKVYFIRYSTSILGLITNFFQNIDIKNISCILVEGQLNKNEEIINFHDSKIEIYIEMEDSNLPFALGSRGHYIHLINTFLRNFIGDLTFFLRS